MKALTLSPLVVTLLLFLGADEGDGLPEVPLLGAKMTIEWVPGTEAVLHVSADSESDLERVRVRFPDGRELLHVDAGASLSRRLASFDIEFPMQSLEELRDEYAEGHYVLRALTIDGQIAVGGADLSFDLPPPTVLALPQSGAVLPAGRVGVGWVSNPAAVAYEIQLEQAENDGLRVRLPPDRTFFRVPPGILARNLPTNLEIAAIGANGNRTLTEVSFFTAP